MPLSSLSPVGIINTKNPDNSDSSVDNTISDEEPPPTRRRRTPQAATRPPLATQPRSHIGHQARPPTLDPGHKGHPRGHPSWAREDKQTSLNSVPRQQPHQQEPIDLNMRTSVQPNSSTRRSRKGEATCGPSKKQLLCTIGTVLFLILGSATLGAAATTATAPRVTPPSSILHQLGRYQRDADLNTTTQLSIGKDHPAEAASTTDP